MKYLNLTLKGIACMMVILFLHVGCSDLQITPALLNGDETLTIQSATLTTDSTVRVYVVPPKTHVIDGALLGLKPGDIIGLDASTAYANLLFRNIVGSATAPITIKNVGGTASINATGLSFALKTEHSRFFRITGGDALNSYGIKVNGGQIGMHLGALSTNFEIDHVEIFNSGFAGIMAKTDPTCDDATIRGNFTMKNVIFRDNYIHETGGEAFYIGNSFYANGMSTSCGIRYPHEIHQLRLYNNIVKNAGWDGIQVGCATVNAKIYGNTVENYGTTNTYNQRNGIQLGEGTGGICYGNLIRKGTGNGMNVLGLGDNVVHDNMIIDAGEAGIFCDERYTPGPGFKFINNTIIRPGADGIRIFANLVPMNVITNNIIVEPGSYSKYVYPRTPNDAYVYKLSKTMVIEMLNNHFTTDINSVGFENLLSSFKLSSTSPLIDKGADVSSYGLLTDFYKKRRLRGLGYDIGAAEFQ
jgi:hypothetical protein